MKRFVIAFCLSVCLALWASIPAQATPVTYGFYCITNTNHTDALIGQSQLFVDVSDYAANQILFTFRNIGLSESCIAQIYFDDGSLLGIAEILDNPPTVDFQQYASPPDLPGGETVDFHVTAGFLAEADNPPPKKGVNPYEEVGILFNLKNEGTFQDVLDELQDATLRIGIHVIDFASGGSESFINNLTEQPIPEPASLLLLSFGAFSLRRFHRSAKIRKNT